MNRKVPATIVNHVAIDIAVDADVVWQVIVHEIVEARSLRDQNAVTALDDPDLPLGGFSTKLDNGEGGIDEQVIHVTERDEVVRRASVRADSVSDPRRMRVYATYQARPIAGGTCFTIDCHTSLELDLTEGSDVSGVVARETAHYQAEMMARLEKVKARLEESK